MPLSEFHSIMKSKLDSSQQKMANCSPAQAPFVPEHELVELLWENGHVVMQGQSNRPKKSSFPCAFPSFSGKTKEKETGDAEIPKAVRYGAADAVGSDLHTSGPLGQVGLGSQVDELVPWLNCPIDEPIDDYCSEFLSEFSGVNPNSLPTTVPTDRPSSFGHGARDAHGLENVNGSRAPVGSSEPIRMNSSQLFQFPQQYHTLSTGSRQKELDVAMGTAHQGPRGDLPATRLHKQDLTTSKLMQPYSSSAPVMNFSHFSRPVALVKANLLGVDRVRGSEKASTAASCNPMESTLVESATALKSVSALHGRLASVAAKADLNPPVQPSQELAFVGPSEAICQEDVAKSSGNHKKTDGSSNRRTPDHMKCQDPKLKTMGQDETENRHEPAIASSSVCSANGAGAASNDIKNREKRKSQEGEESEYPSEDQEDDSTDVRKQSIGKKRSRAAEVHNLSERRRRDRINEKMRALQELIPNCNKVDKASMLDEAIEYLKTLQMQVQIMSMGSGLCVPPMMLSTGMQHIRAPHMGPFSPMGMGMGMGMGLGFGMGLFDMTRSPLIPIPRMHGPQYPCASIPGTAGPHGMHGSANPRMFGIPGQALPMSMPHPPPFSPLTGMTANVNPVPEEPAAELSPLQASDSAPSSSKDQQLNTLGQVTKTSTDNTPAELSRQASKECFDLPSIVQIDSEPPNSCGCEATINSGGGIRLRP